MHLDNRKKSYAPALVLTTLAFFSCAAIFLSVPAGAQKIKQLPPPPPAPRYKPKPTPTPEYEIVRVSSNLVIASVSVTDAKGQPVLGLKSRDFSIEEDGRAQEIVQIGDPEQVPLDIALLIDVSSSVSERFAFEEQAATRFLKQVLRSADRATIFAIDRTPRLEQALTSAPVLAKNTPEQHRRVILVISDGEDNFSNLVRDSAVAAYRATKDENDSTPAARQRIRTASEAALLAGHRKAQEEVQQEVQKANAVFYAINPSGQALRLNVISTRAQNGMQNLAIATGGTAFVPEKTENLEAVFDRIASELRSQYLLQYYSNNKSGGASFRRINVSTPAQPQLHVRAREGYFPKGK